jgi:photosystem II stability/assembly factor-like uncharacterized protein
MKRLFVFVPAILLVIFLLNSFIKKQKEPGDTISDETKSFTGPGAKVNRIKSEPAGIVFKSIDGGQTWQDIGEGLPETEQPVNFFAGETDIYLHVKDVIYHSKSDLEAPVWVIENVPYSKGASIAFNRSGVMAFNHQGLIYQKKPAAETWSPIHTNLKRKCTHTIFETSDGTIFLGADNDLYKSADKGKNWKQVQENGLPMNIVESGGVLMATGKKGIMRSADNGEHWQWVISEGGVGIDIERIQGGFAAISYNTETKSRRIRISLDSGKTWQAIDEGLRPSLSVSSIKQIGKYLIIGHPDGIFRSSDMGKTWTLVHPGVDKVDKNEFRFVTTWNSEPENVFRIYVTGNVLYAVAGSAGC